VRPEGLGKLGKNHSKQKQQTSKYRDFFLFKDKLTQGWARIRTFYKLLEFLFYFNLGLLNVACDYCGKIASNNKIIVDNELGRSCRLAVRPKYKLFYWYLPGGLRTIRKLFSQDNRSLGRISTQDLQNKREY
jgi:hypothetical protein